MTSRIAERRATVARMRQDGASFRAIADRLGISKDTVSRDLAAIRDAHETVSETPDETPSETPRTRIAAYATRAETTMRHLATAVSDTLTARPSHAIIPTRTAHQWATQLRQHAAALTTLADQFDESYPPTTITSPPHTTHSNQGDDNPP